MPHMHLRGKDFLYEAIYPDGKTETLLSVPHYDFQLAEHLPPGEAAAPAGRHASIDCIAHFDNSENNPNNPDPNKAVVWGDQTWEEMMIGFVDYAYSAAEKPK